MKDLFSIGEISKLFRIKVSALRFYCDTGLVTPAYVDEKTGYRYFSTVQFELLNTIRYLQALGFSLENIKAFLRDRNTENIVSMLWEQKRETEAKIAELMQIERKLENRIGQITDATDESRLEQILEVSIPERTAVVLRREIAAGEDLELPIRILENSADMQSAVFLGKVGLSMKKERFAQSQFGVYQSIFLIVENEEHRADMQKKLPGGRYAVLRFRGTHEDAPQRYRKLLDYLAAEGKEAQEDPLEITLVDYGLTSDPQNFVTEIQIYIGD